MNGPTIGMLGSWNLLLLLSLLQILSCPLVLKARKGSFFFFFFLTRSHSVILLCSSILVFNLSSLSLSSNYYFYCYFFIRPRWALIDKAYMHSTWRSSQSSYHLYRVGGNFCPPEHVILLVDDLLNLALHSYETVRV